MSLTRADAEALDATDPLAPYLQQFYIVDPELCYLDGTSLGRLPLATVHAVNEFLTEWGDELVDGWAHWINEARTTGDLLGRAVLGAAPGQTLVQDTTSMNLYQLCSAAVAARPDRRTVIIDSANFPTDRYILAGIALRLGLRLLVLDNDGTGEVPIESEFELITPEALEPHLEDAALVSLQVVQYRSGALQDVPGITELVRRHGGLVVWDAAHAAGSVDLQFDQWGVDLAVGCTYKYGNSGPGSPAWLYVNRDIQSELDVPIHGWFASDRQFEMGPAFEKAPGIRAFQVASPSIVGLRAVQTSFAMIEQAGMPAISAKAARGTDMMIELFDEWLEPLGFDLRTPRDAGQRGGHISIGHPEARRIAAAMRRMTNTIPDYRVPDSIRLAISPLPTRYLEVWEGLNRLRDLVASRRYLDMPDVEGGVT